MSSWSDQTKNSASFSDQTKNSASFTNQDVTFNNTYLLQENGSYLLLENSGKIILTTALPAWSDQSKN